MEKRRRYTLCNILILIILCLVLVLTRCRVVKPIDEAPEQLKGDDGASPWIGYQSNVEHNQSGTISIPGFKELQFKAKQKLQRVNFYNPDNNGCLFLMSLYVGDELYWESGYVEPGKCYYEIELMETIPIGVYDAELHIQCFKQSGERLNSANVAFQLSVVEE